MSGSYTLLTFVHFHCRYYIVHGNLQVKVLVPNSTAGMIIGKGGAYIKQIKEESGAFIQISQKAKDQQLTERCITIIGEMEHNQKAVQVGSTTAQHFHCCALLLLVQVCLHSM